MAERYSDNPKKSIDQFVDKFGMRDDDLTEDVLDYRMSLFEEETQETIGAWRTKNPEELIDGHIDTIVIAMGNLAIFGVNFDEAFEEVMRANMSKERGKRRPTDPDNSSIVKPERWVAPDHSDNHGELDRILRDIDEILGEN